MGLPRHTREKVRRHLEEGKWGSAEALGEQTGKGGRNIRRWIYEGKPVTDELEVLKSICKAFGPPWNVVYLVDESQSYPPPAQQQAINAAARLLPERFRELVVACADERKADFLLAQLRLLEQASQPGRRG